MFCFVKLPFFPSDSWPLFLFPLPLGSLDSCAKAAPDCGWAFVPGHFLASVEYADGIGSRPAAWNYVPV